jgi:hypothetical protein
MNLSRHCFVLGLLHLFSSGCSAGSSESAAAPAPLSVNNTALPAPPVAEKKPFEVVAPHGAARQDEYYWAT